MYAGELHFSSSIAIQFFFLCIDEYLCDKICLHDENTSMYHTIMVFDMIGLGTE